MDPTKEDIDRLAAMIEYISKQNAILMSQVIDATARITSLSIMVQTLLVQAGLSSAEVTANIEEVIATETTVLEDQVKEAVFQESDGNVPEFHP